MEPNPYAGIPLPTERAAARRRIEQMQQGEPFPGPLPHNATGIRPRTRARPSSTDDDGPPDVAPDQTRHAPMFGRHSHDHAASGADDADDGIHRHSHQHSGDAIHRHSHDRA